MSSNKSSVPIVARGEAPLLQPIDIDGMRDHFRAKSKALVDKRMTEEQAIERFVHSGDYLGIELYGTVRCPMSLTRALVRSSVEGLRMAGQGVHEADLLIASGKFEAIDVTYIGQEVYGVSSVLRRAVESGQIKRVVEWSNGAISWRFKAAAMGVPFIPARVMLGSDTFKYSAAQAIQCPFTGQTICLLPALFLDVGMIHVSRADKYGNCQIDGVSGFAGEMARASKRLLISAEQIVDEDQIRERPDRTLIPYYMVDAVVEAPFGSWPGEMAGAYERDEEHYRMFVKATKSAEATQDYMRQWVYGLPDHAALLEKVGTQRLEALRIDRGDAS
ncbi:MAG: CoA-transferase [Candidatus Alcyoniella australis]|nr:CoA-transferase [Candidatus Alcyoniella australis]